jgi:hypothetical protein
MVAPALWTTLLSLDDPVRRVIFNPRTQLTVECFKKGDILNVILSHLPPALIIAPHAAGPQLMARVPDLLSKSQKLTNVVEFVGDKSEFRFANLVKVEMLGGGGWSKAVLKPFAVKNGDVELFSIVMYDDIR